MKNILTAACVGLVATVPFAADVAVAADGDSPWQIRVRAIGVIPDEDGSSNAPGVISNGGVDISDAYVPELDITYFFTKNIAAELILATAPHDVEWDLVAGGDLDLGEVWLLPPTLTLQYHFNPEGKIRPYAGAGINYTIFYNVDDGDADDIRYDDGFGYALQAGVDYMLTDNWLVNFDVKKLWLDTDVEVDVLGTTVDADVDIDPWIVGIGFGYKY